MIITIGDRTASLQDISRLDVTGSGDAQGPGKPAALQRVQPHLLLWVALQQEHSIMY